MATLHQNLLDLANVMEVADVIVGGEDAIHGEFPYMALLAYVFGKQKFYMCGGSVINTKYVLTAAHCHSERKKVR